jgi:predicted adenine nucleotide alpha hydrolase (AANH) superfamily ATPase
VKTEKEEILVHACCAPCSTYVIDILSEVYNVTTLFYNPNIQPEKEYKKRLNEMERLCDIKKTELLVVDYNADQWYDCISGFEDTPEGGERCSLCFEIRLLKTAEIAAGRGWKKIATSLSVSPHKNVHVINSAGKRVSKRFGMDFLESDFKKNDGYRKSCELSRLYGLYRQNYCGCRFSMELKTKHVDGKKGK